MERSGDRVTAQAAVLPTREVSILVIDDDVDNREAFDDVLSEAGYQVVCAHDGAQALELLRSLRPDLILLDLNMPIMDGVEFRAAQARDPSLARIPTVVMTADRLTERILGLAPAATVTKPLKLSQLLSIIERHTPAI
ncbi:MAG TPA: response regulator [Kofleriaceae bacterium]|nr:response regulator [Kofleriaceae bacterium]